MVSIYYTNTQIMQVTNSLYQTNQLFLLIIKEVNEELITMLLFTY